VIRKKPTTRYECWITDNILGGRHGRYISCIGMEQAAFGRCCKRFSALNISDIQANRSHGREFSEKLLPCPFPAVGTDQSAKWLDRM